MKQIGHKVVLLTLSFLNIGTGFSWKWSPKFSPKLHHTKNFIESRCFQMNSSHRKASPSPITLSSCSKSEEIWQKRSKWYGGSHAGCIGEDQAVQLFCISWFWVDNLRSILKGWFIPFKSNTRSPKPNPARVYWDELDGPLYQRPSTYPTK